MSECSHSSTADKCKDSSNDTSKVHVYILLSVHLYTFLEIFINHEWCIMAKILSTCCLITVPMKKVVIVAVEKECRHVVNIILMSDVTICLRNRFANYFLYFDLLFYVYVEILNYV